jgi:tetratricopeptide (TPR) repeat protein
MSNSSVMSRKDMKEPDKFQVAAGQAAGWLQGHRRQVAAAGAVAAVAVVAAIAILAWRQSRAEKASAALADVTRAMAGEIATVPLPGVQGPFFPDEAARQRAVADAAEKVRREFGGTKAAHTATLALGDARLKLREWDAALAAYRDYLATAAPRDSMRFGALEGIAMAEEGKGNLDAAAQGYERLAREVPFYADRADLERARVLAAAGKGDEARKLLASFGETHKDSALTGEAAERLARLGGK